MPTNSFTIPARLPGLNELIGANRRGWHEGARLKADTDGLIRLAIRAAMRRGECRPAKGRVRVSFLWRERTRRRDLDNIFSAKKFVLDAIAAGKCVVTANKKLLAEHGREIFDAAEAGGGTVFYEASVAGGIPIIKSLREGFVGNRINRIFGILNGTCNYIFTRMERENLGFEEVLKDAQRLGYAEANPSLDIDGFDTAHKAVILASLARRSYQPPEGRSPRGSQPICRSFRSRS